MHDNWDELRAVVERGEVGIWYANGKYYRIERVEYDEDDEMKKIYWLYAVNVDTEQVMYREPFVGPGNEDEAKQFATLEYSEQIKALGDSKDIKVFVEPVADFKSKND